MVLIILSSKKTLNAIGSKNWLMKKVKISRHPKQVSYEKSEITILRL